MLEDVVDRSPFRGRRGGHTSGDLDSAAVQSIQTGHYPQQRRLAAAGRSEEGNEFPLGDAQIDAVESADLIEVLRDSR